MLTYARGLIGYTAYNFFSSDFEQTRSQDVYVSTWFWVGALRPFGKIMIVLGIIGALWLIVSRPGRLRLLGVAHIVATALYFSVALSVVRFAPELSGPVSGPFPDLLLGLFAAVLRRGDLGCGPVGVS